MERNSFESYSWQIFEISTTDFGGTPKFSLNCTLHQHIAITLLLLQSNRDESKMGNIGSCFCQTPADRVVSVREPLVMQPQDKHSATVSPPPPSLLP